MATAQTHLATYGVSMQVARDFIMNNLNDISTIHSTCLQFGVNNDMIAEILASDFPGVTGSIVSSFFDSNGFSGSTLGYNETADTDDNIIYNEAWILEDGTSYYELGNSGLILERGDDYWVMGSYSLSGDTITLTDLSDNSSLDLVLTNFVSGGSIYIPSDNETVTINSVVDTMDYDTTISWDMLGLGYTPQEYYNAMARPDTSSETVDFNEMKISEGSNTLYNRANPSDEIGVATVHDGALYLAYENDGSLELAIANGTTQEMYYLGEIA